MKIFNKLLCIVLITIAVSGCSSFPKNGRLAVARWDSRSAEQLEKARYNDGVVFGATEGQTARAGESSARFSAWQPLFDLIASLRVKVEILSIEWASPDNCIDYPAE